MRRGRRSIYAVTILAFTAVQLFMIGIVVFFYLLDCLLAERKDRSILFWKSLPVPTPRWCCRSC